MEAFWSKVCRQDGACWLWQGRLYRDGYGEFVHSVDGKRRSVAAHRFAFTLNAGRPPAEGLVVCHHCDNRACCNPEHLFEGTQLDNVRDMIAKGRDAAPPSEFAGFCRRVFTDSEVAEVRRLVLEGVSFTALSRKYGVGISTVCDAAYGRTYEWVTSVAPLPHGSRPRGRPRAS